MLNRSFGYAQKKMDFGVWILDFGSVLVFILFAAAPNRVVWILDLDFGFGSGLSDIVWILHEIFPYHVD